jgi:hypothetical protein
MFVGPQPILHIFFVTYNLEVCGLIFYHYTLKGYLLMAWGKLKPEVIRKTHPRPILAFVKAVLGHGCFTFPYRERSQNTGAQSAS